MVDVYPLLLSLFGEVVLLLLSEQCYTPVCCILTVYSGLGGGNAKGV